MSLQLHFQYLIFIFVKIRYFSYILILLTIRAKDNLE